MPTMICAHGYVGECPGCARHIDTPPARTITVNMGGIGESWTLPHVPRHLVPIVEAADKSGRLTFGPDYSRQMAEAVRDLGRADDESAEYFAAKILSQLAQ